MSNVTLHIGGRNFTVACADGEEEHISGLGRLIDQKLHAMGGAAGQNETRMLLFATLLLADEVHEARHGRGAPPPDPASFENPKLAQRLEGIATALEKCATGLEELGQQA